MTSEASDEWVILRTFDEGELAHDVTTALLAMEYPASLLDVASGCAVAGVGASEEGEASEAGVLLLRPTTPDLALPEPFGVEARLSGLTPESEEDAALRRTTGGPWRLLVPAEFAAELEPVIETVVEEQVEFEGTVHHRRARRRIAMRVAGLAGGLVLVLYLVFTTLLR